MKRLFGLLLAVILVAETAGTMVSAKAVASNGDMVAITLVVGEKHKITEKGAVYGSTDPSVASVSSKGVIKAKSEGYCQVAVTKKNKTILYDVRVQAEQIALKVPIDENGRIGCDISTTIAGNTIIWNKTTLDEAYKMFKCSDISFSCSAYADGSGNIYSLAFVLSDEADTVLARIQLAGNPLTLPSAYASVISRIELTRDAYKRKDCYYFCDTFNPLANNIAFDIFDINDYFIFFDENLHATGVNFQNEDVEVFLALPDNVITFYFDKTTHKCTFINILL